MKKPVIGILLAESLNPSPECSHTRQSVSTAYIRAVEAGGGIPLAIPSLEDQEGMEPLMSVCDGFLLPGGIDVDPRLYGEEPHALLGHVDLAADRAGIRLVAHAKATGKPILAICRGIQLLNVALGGTLCQDLSLWDTPPLLHRQTQKRSYPLHQVTILPDSHLTRILGVTEVYTNTLHHQCIKACAADLRITARTADGIPEAAESPDGKMIAVQWHPEELLQSVPCMLRLFEDLVQKASK